MAGRSWESLGDRPRARPCRALAHEGIHGTSSASAERGRRSSAVRRSLAHEKHLLPTSRRVQASRRPAQARAGPSARQPGRTTVVTPRRRATPTSEHRPPLSLSLPQLLSDDQTGGFRNPGGTGVTCEYYPPGNQFQVNQADPVQVATFDQGAGSRPGRADAAAQQLGIAEYNCDPAAHRQLRPPGLGYRLRRRVLRRVRFEDAVRVGEA